MTQSHQKEKERQNAHIPNRGRGRRGDGSGTSQATQLKESQVGQEEVMSPQQWFQAMSHVREKIVPILARRRGQRPRRRQQQQDNDQQ